MAKVYVSVKENVNKTVVTAAPGAACSVTSSSVTTGWIDDRYYPRNNPSGYITSGSNAGVDSVNLIDGQVTINSSDFYVSSSGQSIGINNSREDYSIIRNTGNQIEQLQYASKSVFIYRSGDIITGIDYGAYKKKILFGDSGVITGVTFIL